MSLILDALNRSRDDANPVPGLSTHHSVEAVTAERQQYLLWVALAVAVVVIAWLALDKFGPSPVPLSEIAQRQTAPPTAPAEPTDIVTAQSVPDQVVQPVPSPSATAIAEPVAVSAEPVLGSTESAEVNSIYASTRSGPSTPDPYTPDPSITGPSAAGQSRSTSSPPVSSESVDGAPMPSSTADAAVAQLYQNPQQFDEPVQPKSRGEESASRYNEPSGRSASSEQSASQNIDVDRILRMAQEEAQNAGLRDHPVPFLIDLSQQVKDSIPTVYYLRHDYSSDTSQSSVVLNSKTLKVGGSPSSGMKIEEILPDSVVLNYQGTQFRLRALNSWVNL
jgi:hypothetical protein